MIKFTFHCDRCGEDLEPTFEPETGTNVPKTVATWLVQNTDGTYSFELSTDEMYGFTCRCADADVINDPTPEPKHCVMIAHYGPADMLPPPKG